MADRLLDRLEDCRRSFERAIILGGAGAKVAERLAGGRAGIQVGCLLPWQRRGTGWLARWLVW